MKKAYITIALAGILVAGCGGSGLRLPNRSAPGANPADSVNPVAAAPVPQSIVKGKGTYLGVYESEGSASYSQVNSFANRVGRQPNLVLYFSGFREQFQEQFATAVHAHGAIPLVQLDPATASLAAITAGKYDAHLRSYAASVRNYRWPVILSFAHEPDGSWYSWGYKNVSPAAWITAWRHVVNVFRAEGARNVIWLWTMNVSSTSPYPLHAWWPGNRYVTWTGLDGYYANPTDKFAALFGDSIRQIRSFTHEPILIAETAVGPQTGNLAGDVRDLFHGIHRDKIIGPVWFDVGGLSYRQDWRLQDPTEIAAFRRALRKCFGGPCHG